MAYQGMDVDVVERAGRDLKSRAEELRRLAQSSTVTVTRLADRWQGSDATTFASQTWPSLRSQALAAATELEQMAEIALTNAAEQRAASSTGAGGRTTAGGSSPTRTSPTQGGGGGGTSQTPTYLDVVNDVWNTELVDGVSLGDTLKLLPGVDTVAGNVEKFTSLMAGSALEFDPVDYFANKALDFAESTLNSLGTVGKLGSLAIGTTRMAAERAQDVDWSGEAFDQAAEWAAQNPMGVVEEVGKAALDVGMDLVGRFKWW